MLYSNTNPVTIAVIAITIAPIGFASIAVSKPSCATVAPSVAIVCESVNPVHSRSFSHNCAISPAKPFIFLNASIAFVTPLIVPLIVLNVPNAVTIPSTATFTISPCSAIKLKAVSIIGITILPTLLPASTTFCTNSLISSL